MTFSLWTAKVSPKHRKAIERNKNLLTLLKVEFYTNMDKYTTPAIEEVEVVSEGVLCGSNEPTDETYGTWSLDRKNAPWEIDF